MYSEPLYPISIIGDSSTGKTSLIVQFTSSTFDENMTMTVGIDYFMKDVKCNDGNTYKIKIMDTAGQEQYHSMTLHMLKLCKGILLVYSITDKNSFDNLESKWINEINEFININNIPIVLVGNKKDLENDREVDEQSGRDFADKYNLNFFETSSKTGENVNLAFEELVNEVVKSNNNVNKNEIKNKNNTENKTEDINNNINTNQTYKLNLNNHQINNKIKPKNKCC